MSAGITATEGMTARAGRRGREAGTSGQAPEIRRLPGRGLAILLSLAVAAVLFAVPQGGWADDAVAVTEETPPANLLRLIRAYPDHLERAERGPSGWKLVWKDGTRQIWDDGRTKDYQTRFNEADLEDMFAIPYPVGREGYQPAWDVDPGRFRCQALLRKMYGDAPEVVSWRLRRVVWTAGGGREPVFVTSVNGVDRKLAEVNRELSALPQGMRHWLVHPETYVWRRIAGEKTLSAHSFGIAVDVAPQATRYWRWAKTATFDRPPPEVVDIFEKYGFIWGGKWSRYDDMHFEYRPELLTP